ncbi:tRNA dimethylallyltransferase [Tsuneonella deserti]|uniref:tRNA dimethylallyltransferase n=1 Tax=Tsuneonella deserti TaxID=2035528 RepID=A0ABQ1S757_9SPHN|nr:tRNA (adenosine(37)-N6)-dimethylallyltransferase MiaA [Tsuneonella deserti]GGD92100.1 tRNA dimethylallyltransferase [Tsuneonella deserti]
MSTDNPPELGGERPPVALIAGPTASGKSDLAVGLALARAKRGLASVVINADSAQVYADLAVLSARPSEQEMQGIAHRLFGAWDGATACSAADWAAAARAEITTAHAVGALPILVGGTGLYLRTLIEGIAPVPPIDPEVRTSVRELHVSEAHASLVQEDPERAGVLSPNDTARVARALEVVRSTGKTLAYWQARRSGGIANEVTLSPVILTAEREWLFGRCDRRFANMVDAGAVAEVETLVARRLDPALPVMRAIGVSEIAAWLEGLTTREEAIAKGQLATRQYAKRQATWFRNQPPEDWPRFTVDDSGWADKIETLFPFVLLT